MRLHHGAAARGLFFLENGIAFLNHGSYGLTPRAVLAEQRRWQLRLERQPVRFMTGELPALLPRAASALAGFLGAEAQDLVLVENATTGVNAVLRSIDLAPGEEVLVIDQVYPAVRNAVRHLCMRAGAAMVEAPLALPIADEGAVVEQVRARLTPRTRLLVVDLVTSPTAAVLPVAALAKQAKAAGARVLVDAAHGPGQVELDLPSLGADWVTGNAHKWLFAPKGTAFLWARRDAQAGLHPTAISHGYGRGFQEEFAWTGTRDPSAWLSLPTALDFYRRQGGAALRGRNRDLAAQAAELLSRSWRSWPAAPPAMRASMASLALPAAFTAEPRAAAALHDRLLDRHGIEVPIIPQGDRLWLRISAQIYNELADYERLASAVAAEMA